LSRGGGREACRGGQGMVQGNGEGAESKENRFSRHGLLPVEPKERTYEREKKKKGGRFARKKGKLES